MLATPNLANTESNSRWYPIQLWASFIVLGSLTVKHFVAVQVVVSLGPTTKPTQYATISCWVRFPTPIFDRGVEQSGQLAWLITKRSS